MVDASTNLSNQITGRECETEVCAYPYVDHSLKPGELTSLFCSLTDDTFCQRCIIQTGCEQVGVIINKPCSYSSLLLIYQQVIKYQTNKWVPKGLKEKHRTIVARSPLLPLRINLEYILSLFLKVEPSEVQKMLSWCINGADRDIPKFQVQF
ncbi:MAG: hypothetical protein KAR35_08395 [Candidatus Heimdallarchaeota archaeon]|nr:hypothetical protein [Candidatus Heimdallarchaeota archaeon]MCK5049376.1 hypothetical protein [Candidatus Heimdallarchaeota archaeon]